MLQPLRHIRADCQPQGRIIARAQGFQNMPVVRWRRGPAQPRIQLSHGRPKLQPNGFQQPQNGRALRAQVKRAVKFQIGPNIADRVLAIDGAAIGLLIASSGSITPKMRNAHARGCPIPVQQRPNWHFRSGRCSVPGVTRPDPRHGQPRPRRQPPHRFAVWRQRLRGFADSAAGVSASPGGTFAMH